MSGKKATHVVKHKRLYLAVEGKLTHFPEGKQLTLTKAQADRMGDRVMALGSEEATDLTEAKAESKK